MNKWFTVTKNSKEIAEQRRKAQALKKSAWWQNILQKGICHYCQQKFEASELTMDHIVPVARGGLSVKNNVVPACKSCNQNKKLEIPVESLLEQIKKNSSESNES